MRMGHGVVHILDAHHDRLSVEAATCANITSDILSRSFAVTMDVRKQPKAGSRARKIARGTRQSTILTFLASGKDATDGFRE